MALQKIYNNFYVGFKTDLPQNLPLGSTFVSTDSKEMYGYDENREPFLIGSGAIDYRKLNNVGLKFHWSNSPNKDGQNEAITSTRINGEYDLLGVTLHDFSPLKQKPNGEVYTLLIDRYRSKSYKATKDGSVRKAGYKHELSDDLTNNKRKNSIEIDNSTMILDFAQDFYFKDWKDDFNDHKKYPSPTGTTSKRSQSFGVNQGSVHRKGWVDLAFRIRVERKGSVLYETKHLGFIRMLAVSNNDTNDIKNIINRITYSIK